MSKAQTVTQNEPAWAGVNGAGHRIMALVRAALIALGLTLSFWNCYLLTFCFYMMPRNDFGRPLWDTIAFLRGQAMYAHNLAVHWPLDDMGIESIDLWNLNPPHFLLLFLPLAVLEPTFALLLWCLVGVLCLYLSLRIIIQEIPLELTPDRRQWVVLGILSCSGMGTALVTGHMSFVLMLLITLVWRNARRERWIWAGALLGVGMSIKPFLLVFIPYLVLKRHWRGVVVAGMTASFCFLLGLAVFGVDNHLAWLQKLSMADSWAWLPMNASLFGFLRRALSHNPFYSSLGDLGPGKVRVIWLCLAMPAGLAALLVSLNDSSRTGIDRAFSLLLVSALLLSPLGWTYYFWLPLGPTAAVATGWWRHRPARDGGGEAENPPWQRLLLLLATPGLFSPAFATLFYQPLPLATLFYGGISFWSLLLVWLALIVDGLDLRSTGAPARLSRRFAQKIGRF